MVRHQLFFTKFSYMYSSNTKSFINSVSVFRFEFLTKKKATQVCNVAVNGVVIPM